jgi:hypothetical protein
MLAILLMLVGLGVAGWGLYQRVSRTSRGEPAPDARTNPGAFAKLRDVLAILIGIFVFAMGVMIFYYGPSEPTPGEDPQTAPPVTTGELGPAQLTSTASILASASSHLPSAAVISA